MNTTSLSAKRWNKLHDAVLERAREQMASLREAFLVDGYPPFHEPLDDLEMYQRLATMRAANSDAYWNDPQAVATFARLAERFGPPPAPFGPIPTAPQMGPGQPIQPPGVM